MSAVRPAAPAISSRAALLRALKPPLPREHGTWAWMLLPALTGLLAINSPSLPAWMLFFGAILGFFLRASMEAWRAGPWQDLRYLAWAILFGVAMHAAIIPPVSHWDRWILLPLGAGVALGPLSVGALRWLRVSERVLGEAIVVGSLCLLAPAVAYAGTGEFDRWTAFLWLPPALYLWGSITYVRLSLAPATERAARLRGERRRTVVLYHAALPLALAATFAGGAMPALAALAFIPMMLKAGYALWRDVPASSVQRLGFGEAAHAALFAALLSLLYRIAA